MINQRLKESDSFRTRELSLTAALVSWNFPLEAVDKSNPDKVVFIFLKTPELTSAIEAFWNNTDKILPKVYFNALREIKSRIHELEDDK